MHMTEAQKDELVRFCDERIEAADRSISYFYREGRFGSKYLVQFDRFTPYDGVSIDVVDFGGRPWVQFGSLGEPNTKGFIELGKDGQKVWVLVYAATGAVRVTDDINEVASF